VKCACCGRSVKMTDWMDHPMSCNVQHVSGAVSHVKPSKKRKGQHLQPGSWTNAQPPVGVQDTPLVLANCTPSFPVTGVQETPTPVVFPGLVGAALAYPFKTFAFDGPQESELRGRHFKPLPPGSEEVSWCCGEPAATLSAEERAVWDMDPLNWHVESVQKKGRCGTWIH
jgi:hypothetical protein